MSYKILEQNGVENENIDGGAFNNFAAGGLDGILRGVLSECKLVAEGNVLNIAPGVLLMHGFRVKIFESESISITSIPVAATRYQIVAQIVYSESSVAFSMFIQEPIELVKQNFFETGNGKYQIEIGRFTHNTDGSIGDLQRTADIISGGSGGGTGSIEVGNVETSMLEEGLPVEVDIDKRVENGVTILDFKFAFPKASAGSDFDPNGTYDSLTAGKAKKDENGNNIPETYATKAEVQAKYTKPSSGIPESDLASSVQTSLNNADTAYQKPSIGIPETDLSQDVKDKLNAGSGAEVEANPTETGTENLTSLKVDDKVYNIPQSSGGGIVAVDSLPNPTQTEYEKHLLYLQGVDLSYLVAEPVEEPTVDTVAAFSSSKSYTSAVTVGTNCYIFSGTEIIKFDTISQIATTLELTLPSSKSSASAAAVGTNCYVFGGPELSDIIKFDTVSQTVTKLSAVLPTKRRLTSAAAVGTNCYVFGGIYLYSSNTTKTLPDIVKFDTVSQTVTKLSVALPSKRLLTGAAAVGTNCYVFGGSTYENSDYLSDIIKFDTVSQTVTKLSAVLPTKRHNISAAVVGTNCYVFGGYDGNYLSDIVKFDTVSQTVTKLSVALPSTRRATSAAAVGTNCYVFGGYPTAIGNQIVQVSFGYTYSYKTLLKQGDITYETV